MAGSPTQLRIEKIIAKPGMKKVRIEGIEDDLPVSEETVYRHRLVDGIVITQSQLDILRQESDQFLCDREAARLLALREHSVGELTLKLKRKKFAPESISKVLARYRSAGLLDDSRVAERLGQQLIARRPCGRSFLIGHLLKKRIDRKLAEQTADSLLSEGDDIERACAALEKRLPHLSQFELEPARHKAYSYLARRGFSYETAKQAVERLITETSGE